VTGCQTPNSFCRSATVSGRALAQCSSCCGSGESGAGEISYRDVKHYKRRKRWLS